MSSRGRANIFTVFQLHIDIERDTGPKQQAKPFSDGNPPSNSSKASTVLMSTSSTFSVTVQVQRDRAKCSFTYHE
jgi:hypothetical protein